MILSNRILASAASLVALTALPQAAMAGCQTYCSSTGSSGSHGQGTTTGGLTYIGAHTGRSTLPPLSAYFDHANHSPSSTLTVSTLITPRTSFSGATTTTSSVTTGFTGSAGCKTYQDGEIVLGCYSVSTVPPRPQPIIYPAPRPLPVIQPVIRPVLAPPPVVRVIHPIIPVPAPRPCYRRKVITGPYCVR